VWVTITVIAGFVIAAVEKARPARRSYLLAGFILLFAFMTFIRREELTRSFSALAALGLLLLLAATLRTGHWTSYRTVDYLISFFKWLGAAITRPFELTKNSNEPLPENPAVTDKPSVRRQAVPVLRGLLLAFRSFSFDHFAFGCRPDFQRPGPEFFLACFKPKIWQS